MKIGQQIIRESKSMTDWINSQKKLYDGLPCKLQNILSADITEAYRNKCEFTIGNYKFVYELSYYYKYEDFTTFNFFMIQVKTVNKTKLQLDLDYQVMLQVLQQLHLLIIFVIFLKV